MATISNFSNLVHRYTEPVTSHPVILHPVSQFAIQMTIELVKIAVVTKFLELVTQQLVNKASYSSKWKASIVLITLIAPIAEEIIFRGILLRGVYLIEKCWNHFVIKRELTEKENRIECIVRIQISAILFAAVHLTNPYSKSVLLTQFVFTYVMGTTYAYLSEKYHTLSVSILSHGINNSLVVAVELFPESASILTLAYAINNVGTMICAGMFDEEGTKKTDNLSPV